MITKGHGPTLLKVDLVWALALSLADAQIQAEDGSDVPARAGLSASWNGEKGEVVVLIRDLSAEEVDRYSWGEPILGPDDLDHAIDAGLGFCESLGFLLDSTEFRELEEDERMERLHRWDLLRQTRRRRRRSDSSKAVLARIPLVRKGIDLGGRLRSFF